jgi:hypothetical protein
MPFRSQICTTSCNARYDWETTPWSCACTATRSVVCKTYALSHLASCGVPPFNFSCSRYTGATASVVADSQCAGSGPTTWARRRLRLASQSALSCLCAFVCAHGVIGSHERRGAAAADTKPVLSKLVCVDITIVSVRKCLASNQSSHVTGNPHLTLLCKPQLIVRVRVWRVVELLGYKLRFGRDEPCVYMHDEYGCVSKRVDVP